MAIDDAQSIAWLVHSPSASWKMPGYQDHLNAQGTMEQAAPHAEAVKRAMAPFMELPADVGRKRNLPVWASKALHFSSRLLVFPVLDKFAQQVLGVRASLPYGAFVADYRQPFLDHLDRLRGAADVDPHSPTLLRRFDKVLYQRGLEFEWETTQR